MATEAEGIERERGASGLPTARRRKGKLDCTVILLVVAVAAGCLGSMGVGTRAMASLLLALAGMGGIALFIAWIYLRKRNPP